jgi:RNA polymerase sigma-70 factor, ECF subfamily
VESSTDAELAGRAVRGDTAAFAVLVHRHYGDCLRYAARMLGDREDAEDAVQEAFVRAFRALPRYDERDRFRGWLMRILRNRCRSLAARRAWRRSRLLQYARAFVPVQPAGPPLEPVDVQRALDALPVKLREAFVLKHIQELSYDEMTKITGASASALKMRVKRACDALERALADGGPEADAARADVIASAPDEGRRP